MQVTVEIPDDMAQRLALLGQDPARAALESLAIEGYRSGALSAFQTRRLLGFETRYELDGFLKAHNVWEHSYGLEDLKKDRETIKQLESEDRLKG
jgi:predicted HTH domain antitoxin